MYKFRGKKKARILANPNVKKITNNHVIFKAEFRAKALELRLHGISPDEIFKQSGFLAADFRQRYFRLLMRRWVDQEKIKLHKPDDSKKKIGRPKAYKNFKTLENLSAKDLKAIILVQQEMIAELKKHQALTKKK